MATHETTEAPDGAATVPLEVRIGFAHAAVQWVADHCGADVLHVKGAALDPSLVPGRMFSDADVLVRPEHLRTMLRALSEHGWVVINSFAFGSSFEHSATLRHVDFGLLDLHRAFPGSGPTPSEAFEAMWAERESSVLGGIACTVPSRDAHALLLLLHAARGGDDPKALHDIEQVWTTADDDARARIVAWRDRLDAGLAFSVITDTLDDHRQDPAYDLWRVAARGGTRLEEWRARFRAAGSPRAKLEVALRSVLVNVEHLTIVRGRPVTRREVAVEFIRRPARGIREQWSRVRRPASKDVG